MGDLSEMILTIALVCFLVGGTLVGICTWLGNRVFGRDYIESTTPIVPQKILTTDGIKVDTIYRYKIKK